MVQSPVICTQIRHVWLQGLSLREQNIPGEVEDVVGPEPGAAVGNVPPGMFMAVDEEMGLAYGQGLGNNFMPPQLWVHPPVGVPHPILDHFDAAQQMMGLPGMPVPALPRIQQSLPNLAGLTKLTSLELGDNLLESVPLSIGKMKALVNLSVRENQTLVVSFFCTPLC